MRKSREVHLTLLAVLALTITGCRDERRDCVDSHGRIVPDSACQAGSSSAAYIGAHYVYGGSSGGNVGDAVVGGSSVSRGGFGGLGGSGGGDASGGE
jgi:hypothetical protein